MAKEHTRYIFSMGELKRKDNSIAFRNKKGTVYLPIEDTRELYCFNEVSFNSKFLDFISKAGICIHFFNYYGYYSGTYYPKEQLISGKLTVKQSESYINNRIPIAKAIVSAIADNIHEILYHYFRHDKKELKKSLDWFKYDSKKWLNKAADIKQILFVEGQIWQEFYGTFKHFLRNDFLMHKRVKRPPDNPINALISFGNSLLYAKTISVLYSTHLNQAISFLHEPSEGRFSLSLDLSEHFKPIIVFRTIFDIVNNRKISASKHFDKKVNYAILTEEGRKIFINAFENRINEKFMHTKLKRKMTYKNAMKIDAYKLIKFILEDKEFIPFRLKEKQ